jgi:hypothetical protein
VNSDYIYHLYSPRADYGVGAPVFLSLQELEGKTGFGSLYGVDALTAKALHTSGTVKGFKGVVWSERLWIDVDGYDKCDAVEERLKELGYDYISFDTGGRGGHFGVRRETNGSHLLPQQDKLWVQEHFPEADTSIYTHLHPFRLPGTSHGKTGRPKRAVGGASGKALALHRAIEIESQVILGSMGCPSAIHPQSIFDNFFIQRNTQEIPKEGERHATLVRLCYALRDGGYSIDVARWWINEANKRWKPPKTEEELEKALRSIYG